MVAELAPPGTLTEAFTWLTTFAFGASAIGSAVGGAVVERPRGVAAAFALAAAMPAVGWLVASFSPGRPGTGDPAEAVGAATASSGPGMLAPMSRLGAAAAGAGEAAMRGGDPGAAAVAAGGPGAVARGSGEAPAARDAPAVRDAAGLVAAGPAHGGSTT
jgi:hypothetical protein